MTRPTLGAVARGRRRAPADPEPISELLPEVVARIARQSPPPYVVTLPSHAVDTLTRLADSEASTVAAVVERIVLDELDRLRAAR